MLTDFLDRWAETDRARLVAAVHSLVDASRAVDCPIIWVRQEFEPDLSDALPEMRRKNIRVTIRGTDGCKIIPELVPHPADTHVIKKRYSAFFGTNLDHLIASNAVDTVVLAGINTHACIRTTAIDAYQRDLNVIIPRDAVGSYDREHETVSLRYMNDKIATVLPLATAIACIRDSAPRA